MSTTTDSQLSGLSAVLPAPLASAVSTTDQNPQMGSTQPSTVESSSTNFIYIYSFLSTLFLLLCIAILVLLRALVRRRRLDRLLNHGGASSNDTAQSTERRRRHKKRPYLGSKPYMSDAWIGSGPLSFPLSTEALLETIQPFSVARAPEGPTSSNEEKPAEKAAPSEVEREPQKKPRLLGLLFSERAPSSSSCGMENEISAVSSENGHPATTPSITIPIPPKPEVEQLQLGFLIAMPRQRTGPSTGSSYSCHLASTSKEALNRNIPSMDEWSLTDSRWTDHLGQGELPELNVGVSTVHVMVDPIAQQQ